MVEHPPLLVGRLADHHRPFQLREVAPHGRARAGHEHVAVLEDDVVRERMRDRRAAPDLAAVAGACAARVRVLAPVEGPERLEHRRRRLVRRALRHLRLGQADARVLLEEPVREVPPLRALADERELGLRLHRHLRLDERDDTDDVAARQLGQRRALVAEDPRIAVLVGADLAGDAAWQRAGRPAPSRHADRPGTRRSGRCARCRSRRPRAPPPAAARASPARPRPRRRTPSAARWG